MLFTDVMPTGKSNSNNSRFSVRSYSNYCSFVDNSNTDDNSCDVLLKYS